MFSADVRQQGAKGNIRTQEVQSDSEMREDEGGPNNLYPSPNYYCDDQIKENRMDGACSTNGQNDKCIQNYGCKASRKKRLLIY
jgi:hypothetical protein